MQAPKVEIIADLPLLASVFQSSHLVKHINSHFLTHGNWSGPSIGKIIEAWLLYILSRSDHRLSYVEDWADNRINSLRHILNCPDLLSSHFTDDRLGIVLDYLSKDTNWDEFESTHTKEFLEVYNLNGAENLTVRLDAFICQGFRKEGDFFKIGHSKQRRKGLPQIKTMVASLDPLSFPIANEIVSGNRADDGLYLPVIEKVQKNVQSSNLHYVGDCKLASIENRSYIHWSNNTYLCPLSKVQCNDNQILEYLSKKPEKLLKIKKEGSKEVLAEAFEQIEIVKDIHNKSWRERRIIVRSTAYAESQIKNFDKKIVKTRELLDKLLERKSGRTHPKTLQEAEQKVLEVLEKGGLNSFFDFKIEEIIEEKTINSYGKKTKRITKKFFYKLKYKTKAEEIEKHKNTLGWRVYVTNAKKNKLNTKQAIECYRAEYKIEHVFNKLLNKVTALVPIFVKKDNRVKGLVRLLLLAIKFDSIIQDQVRKKLSEKEQEIKDIYPGNPGRKTNKPTTQLILSAFKEISLVIFTNPQGQLIGKLTAFSEIQLTLIQLLGFEKNIYSDLENISFFHSDIIET